MMQIKFKNLEPSQLAKEAVQEKMASLYSEYDFLNFCRIRVNIELMSNRSVDRPDLFAVSFHIVEGKCVGLKLQQSDPNLHDALGRLVEQIRQRLRQMSETCSNKNIER